MIQLYFKSALRQLFKHGYYTMLTICGLGLAMACSLFIYIYNSFQLSFDQFHVDKDRTFLVVQDLKLDKIEHSKGGAYAMYDAISREIPQVEKTALYIDNKNLTLRIEDQLYQTAGKASFTSSSYFNILNFPWIQGKPEELDQPNTVALTKIFQKFILKMKTLLEK
ncbi:ABC transporter permease [Sphingobacterium siyangense]|uniref:ABC transporter permease n=1 Tax=Sphingobacterium siyangense TaxID=459529 RepID=UPI003DA215E4